MASEYIVTRLRDAAHDFYGEHPCWLLNEAADEIERLRGKAGEPVTKRDRERLEEYRAYLNNG